MPIPCTILPFIVCSYKIIRNISLINIFFSKKVNLFQQCYQKAVLNKKCVCITDSLRPKSYVCIPFLYDVLIYVADIFCNCSVESCITTVSADWLASISPGLSVETLPAKINNLLKCTHIYIHEYICVFRLDS